MLCQISSIDFFLPLLLCLFLDTQIYNYLNGMKLCQELGRNKFLVDGVAHGRGRWVGYGALCGVYDQVGTSLYLLVLGG